MKPLRLELPTTNVREFVVDLATRHGVTYTKTRYDELAEVITALSDDDVDVDEVSQLITALERAGVVPREQVMALHAHYLREKLHRPRELRMNASDAVRAFQSFGDKSGHNMSVQNQLRDWSASASETASALQAALDSDLLVMDQLGAISKL